MVNEKLSDMDKKKDEGKKTELAAKAKEYAQATVEFAGEHIHAAGKTGAYVVILGMVINAVGGYALYIILGAIGLGWLLKKGAEKLAEKFQAQPQQAKAA